MQIKIHDTSTRGLPLPVTDTGKGEKAPQLILHVSMCLCGGKKSKPVNISQSVENITVHIITSVLFFFPWSVVSWLWTSVGLRNKLMMFSKSRCWMSMVLGRCLVLVRNTKARLKEFVIWDLEKNSAGFLIWKYC